jgi:hypothetical protein
MIIGYSVTAVAGGAGPYTVASAGYLGGTINGSYVDTGTTCDGVKRYKHSSQNFWLIRSTIDHYWVFATNSTDTAGAANTYRSGSANKATPDTATAGTWTSTNNIPWLNPAPTVT